MKKISIVIVFLLFSGMVQACVLIPKDKLSPGAVLPFIDSGKTIPLSELIAMSSSGYKKMTG